jgi:hypothetical protein
MRSSHFIIALVAAIAGVGDVAGQTVASAPAPTAIPWNRNAESYRQGQKMTLSCQPYGTPGTVWGSDIYTSDSSVCTAAVHAGLITFEQGGAFVLEAGPGMASYRGTQRNGVTTQSWAEFGASFMLSPYVPPPPPKPAEPPPPPPTIDWKRDAVGLSPNGRRFTFICVAPAARGVVKGVGFYSWESSICSAAVHAGLITNRGGKVMIEMRPGREKYEGGASNGVTSVAGEKTVLGFVVVREK